jgi:hypothetical protein
MGVMTSARVLGVYRLVFAGLGSAALFTILSHSVRGGRFNPVNFFSFFTIEANLFAVLVLFLTGIGALRSASSGWAWVRGANTLYMTMTGIIYALFLRGLEEALQLPIPWVNTVLHYVMPLAVLTDWLLAPPTKKMSYRQALGWLVFPALYVGYSLTRGALVGWYPYPFLDASVCGYGAVALTCAVFLFGIALLVWVLVARTRGSTTPRP